MRGFEDSDKATTNIKKKQSPAHKKRAAAAAKERKVSNSEPQPTLKKTEEDIEGEKREEKADEKQRESVKDVGGGGDANGVVVETKEKEQITPSLDFFFNETISGLLTVSCFCC